MNFIDEMQNQIKEKFGDFPKVLVGAPNNLRKEYILERYINRLKELTYPNYEIVLADNSTSFKTIFFEMGFDGGV